jgi:hypothetical protein
MIYVVYSFVIFVISTILFHILLFTAWKNKGAKFWKKTDYVWLFLSVIALVGVAERYQQAELERLVQSAEYDLQSEYESQQARLFNLMSNKLDKALLEMDQLPNSEPFLRKIVWRPIMERYSYSSLQLLLATSRPYGDHQSLVESEIKKYKISGYLPVASEASRLLKRGIEAEVRFEELNNNIDQSQWRKFIALVTPFLLALALALRMTKITFEVKSA